MGDVAREGVKDEVACVVCGDYQALAVVGELDLGPLALATSQEALLEFLHVEACKRGLVVVAHVVEEYGLCLRRGDGNDGGGRVVCRQKGLVQVQPANVVRRLQIPQTDGVVCRAGKEVVRRRTQGDGGHGIRVALEVADVRVVVCGEEAQGVVDLCAGVDDALGMVGEARQMDAILLRLELFGVLALFAVVDLEGVVVACDNGKLARVVEVERGDGGARAARLELLEPLLLHCDWHRHALKLTLAGRKLDMTSLVFCVGGPAGGGGGPGVADPVTMAGGVCSGSGSGSGRCCVCCLERAPLYSTQYSVALPYSPVELQGASRI